MTYIYKALLLLTLSLFSQYSYAAVCTQKDNTLNGLVGLDGSSGNLFAHIKSPSNACSCTYVRFASSNTDTQMILSILLSAKMAGKTVRVDFLDSLNCNTGYRAYIQ